MDLDIKSSEEIHKQIDIYLSTLKYGQINIIKHEDKITIDVQNRNRVYINQE